METCSNPWVCDWVDVYVAADGASAKHSREPWISGWDHVWVIQHSRTLYCCTGQLSSILLYCMSVIHHLIRCNVTLPINCVFLTTLD